jgi:Ca2+:H+ antiporter
MNLDSIKSRARHASWKADDESKWDHFNPFMRKRLKRREQAHDEEQARASSSKNRELDLSDPDNSQPPPTHQNTFGSGSGTSTNLSTPVEGANKEYYDSQATTLNGDATDSISRPRKTATGLKQVPEESEGSPDMEKSNSYDDLDDAEKRKRRHDEIMKRKIPVGQQIRAVLFPQWLTINWLLIMAPVGIGLSQTKVEPLVIFIVNFIAIIPLAGILSFATEEIALRVGEVLGGLLNASFGYVVELDVP